MVWAVVSKNLRRLTSTSRSWCPMKSAPRIGKKTSAMRNSHVYSHPSKEMRMFRVPYVRMQEPLAALRMSVVGFHFVFSTLVLGKSEQQALVSMRYWLPFLVSERKKTFASGQAATGGSSLLLSFLATSKVICTFLHHVQNYYGSSKGLAV